MRAWRIETVIAGLVLLTTPSFGQSLAITNAWIRALPGHLPAAAYFVARNTSDDDVIITGAQSPACSTLMLHESTNASGMEKMDDVKSVTVPAHESLAFAPGGYHLMCMEPGPTIKRGAKIPVALQLKDGTSLAATFVVKNARGK